jgi:competence ComEA-like helix-hairpin-helix protein
MLDLTPSERRGALIVLGLIVLGALWDLGHERPRPAPPAPVAEAAAPATAAPALGAPARTAGRGKKAPAGPVDLTTVDAAGLDALPGIGPVLAARIVAHRQGHGPFRSVDELLAVRGVGPRLLERLRPYVRVGPSRTLHGADRAERNASDSAGVQFEVQVRRAGHR